MEYSYDPFNRLDTALGTHVLAGGETGMAAYSVYTKYNDAGGILKKNQSATNLPTGFEYQFDYTYGTGSEGKKHQISVIEDNSASNNAIPDMRVYSYNAMGSIMTIRDSSAATGQCDTIERFVRNEEQWLMGYERVDSSASTIAHYVYDHTGNRILKGGINTASLAQNGQSGSLSMTMDPYTVYVNPYYVVERFSGGPNKVSKHYLVGMERVATNLGEAGPAPGPEGSSEPNGTSQNEPNNSESPLLGNLKFVLSSLGKEEGEAESMIKLENPKYEDYYSTMLDAPEDSGTISTSQRLVFYYHPDYLGNVEFITDMDGYPYQYFWYSAWGESLISEKDNSYNWESSYRFNGKELDEETGLYYYGARYYNPQVSVWLSVDPKSIKGPYITPYSFSHNNPIFYLDPDGKWVRGAGFFTNLFHSDEWASAKKDEREHKEEGAIITEEENGYRVVWLSKNKEAIRNKEHSDLDNIELREYRKGIRHDGTYRSLIDMWEKDWKRWVRKNMTSGLSRYNHYAEYLDQEIAPKLANSIAVYFPPSAVTNAGTTIIRGKDLFGSEKTTTYDRYVAPSISIIVSLSGQAGCINPTTQEGKAAINLLLMVDQGNNLKSSKEIWSEKN